MIPTKCDACGDENPIEGFCGIWTATLCLPCARVWDRDAPGRSEPELSPKDAATRFAAYRDFTRAWCEKRRAARST